MKRLCALLALFTLASCGEDEPDKYANEDGFCNEWAIEACNISIVEECSNDRDECRAAQKAYCKSLVPTGAYEKSGARDCVEYIAEALVDAELTAEERDAYVSLSGECAKVVAGSGGVGDACDATRDCNTAEDLECILKPGAMEGECQVPTEVEPGRDCDGAADVCGEGFYCDAESEACLAQREAEDECSLAVPCEAAFKCVTAEGALVAAATDMGTCVEKAGNGDDCMVDADCSTGICAPNGNCVQRIGISGSSVFEICEDFRQ